MAKSSTSPISTTRELGYSWTGYTSNYDYKTYQWKNPVQAENVDFRNCVMYNAQGTCYGGPGGGQINIVNNYYKAGPSKNLKETTQNGIKVDVSNGKERGNQERITLVTVATSNTADKNHPELYNITSRYYPSVKTTGIEETLADGNSSHSAIARVEYFSLNGTKLATSTKGVYIRKTTLANGKIITDKVIK